jgi:hypothetical protein
MRLDDREIAGRLVVLGFEEEDAELLASMRPWVARVAGRFLTLLYDEQFSHDEFVEIVEAAGSNRQRLLESQHRYLLDLFGGMPDAAYVEARLRIGALHARLHVTPRWFVSSYLLYEKYLFPMIRRHFWWRPRRKRRALAALNKLLNFDKALVLDMYISRVTLDGGATGVGVDLNGASQASELVRRMRPGSQVRDRG